MRIGLFSDSHGNLSAFRAVRDALSREKPDLYLFGGDLCGYYYEQNEILEEMLELQPLKAVLGNHDDMFLKMLDNPSRLDSLLTDYGSGYRRLKDHLRPKTLDFLRSLPERVESPDGRWLLCHGSPWNPLGEYVYPTDDLARFQGLPYEFVFLGHTHYPMHCRSGKVQVVNPGSCGQPRDEQRPSYAIVDLDTAAVRLARVSYDAQPLKSQIDRFDPGLPYLREVLDRAPKVMS